MSVQIAVVSEVSTGELVALYRSVGWSVFADAPETLAAAVAGSTRVVTARRGGRLVG